MRNHFIFSPCWNSTVRTHTHSERGSNICLCPSQKEELIYISSDSMVKCRKGKKQQQFLVVYLPKRDCFSSRWKYAGSRCTSGWEEIEYYCHLNVSFQSYERIWPAKTTISFLFQVFYTFLLAVFVSSFNLLSYMAKRLKLCIFTKWIYLSISSVHLLLFSWVYHYFKLIYVSGIASLCTRSFHRSYRFFCFHWK